jgi:predicted HicB family RNase H-like nuclease
LEEQAVVKEKDTGLSAFTETQEVAVEERTTKANARTKATGKIVHAQLRLNHAQWERAHQFARSEGVSLNQLAIRGMSKLMEEKGLPGLIDA